MSIWPVQILIGLAAVVISAYAVRWLASRFMTSDKAALLGFGFVFGGGSFGFGTGFDSSNSPDALARLAGSLIGLAVVGLVFFKREKVHG